MQQSTKPGWHRSLHPRLGLIDTQGSVAIEPASLSALRPTIYILSRSVCSFSRVTLSGNGTKARAAAHMSAAYKHGYSNTRSRLTVDSSDPTKAGIWCWDGDFMLDNGKTTSQLRILPESLAREAGDDGARLVQCIDGMEGQVWRDQSIVASRWWSQVPSAQEWLQFLRAAQMRVETGSPLMVPTPIDVPFRQDLPIVDLEPESLKLTFAPRRIALVAGTILSVLMVFETSRMVTENRVAASIQNKIETATQDNSAGIEARRIALAARAQITALQKASKPQAIIRPILAISSAVSADGARIANVRVYDQLLEARIVTDESDEISIPDLVSQLEEYEALTNVFVERRNDTTINITATIADGETSTSESNS